MSCNINHAIRRGLQIGKNIFAKMRDCSTFSVSARDKVNSQLVEAPEVLVAECHGINGNDVIHSHIQNPA
jgi:hypothetical protein